MNRNVHCIITYDGGEGCGHGEDFLGRPVVKNSPSSAGDTVQSLVRTPHAMEQLSPRATAREARTPQLVKPVRCKDDPAQPEKGKRRNRGGG